jgi:hypothetical protein
MTKETELSIHFMPRRSRWLVPPVLRCTQAPPVRGGYRVDELCRRY